MSFSDENVKNILDEYHTIHSKSDRLLTAYVAQQFGDTKAREHATHGFGRRLKLLVRCIDNVFAILPPDRNTLPTTDELADATISIQAFLINAFGGLDNLAWMWVREKNLVGEDGTLIPKNQIGLGSKNKRVRRSFSKAFQDHLKAFDGWFDGMTDFRDSLAHRIPLYIPPYVVLKANEAAYAELEKRMADAVNRGNSDEHARLSAEQLRLAEFRPWMTHSFGEGARPVVLHPQLLANFNTVEYLGTKLLAELNATVASAGAPQAVSASSDNCVCTFPAA